jgi:minor extracellular serine protease Vpr
MHVPSAVPRKPILLLGSALFAFGLSAGTRTDRYALILADPPLAAVAASRAQLESEAIAQPRARIENMQTSLKAELDRLNVLTIGSTKVVLNAIYVIAPESELAVLRSLPGVVRVEKMRVLKRHLNRALPLMNVPAAWNTVGGQQSAGLGSKIGILDTGIDQTHPAFKGTGLAVPAGFPKCTFPSDCAFTNNKVIVARSYVRQLSNEFSPGAIDPTNTRPDDFSARDHVGHGTASAMIAAGDTVQGPAASITGVAPKAYLGNYKIFGSPGVNDITFTDVLIQAMEDALTDRMDVITLAIGAPALWGPNDRGPTCQLSGSLPCDPQTDAVENVIRMGMTVVVSAGNDGNVSYQTQNQSLPTLNSIESPGTSPSAITVGATTNSHVFYSSVRVSGSTVPSGVQQINAVFGDGPKISKPLTAPLRDVSLLGGGGDGCSQPNSGSLTGAIALIPRDGSNCTFASRVANAQGAGAVAAIVFQSPGNETLFQMIGLSNLGIPAVLIGSSAGSALQSFVGGHPDFPVTLDPSLNENQGGSDTVAFFSSYGPAIGDGTIKPDLVAIGTGVYTATQSYDPNGDLYDPSGFISSDGTSFAAPFVAGTIALVKQVNPNFTPTQFKSAVVNTANSSISDFDATGNPFPARVSAIGAGKLDAGAAVQSTVEVNPATLSFGVIGAVLPGRTLTLTNSGKSTATLALGVTRRDADSLASISLSSTSVTLSPGASTSVNVRMTGSTPSAGIYEGAVTVTGAGVNLRVPYLYIVSDGAPFDAFALSGSGFDGLANDIVELDVKVLDKYGAPVPNVPVRFYSTFGGGHVVNGQVSATTDNLGIAFADVALGTQIGAQEFAVDINNPPQFSIVFDGSVRVPLVVANNGVVDAASVRVGQGVAPGSYVSIFGSGLSDVARLYQTPYLPVSLGGVSVSFDVPSKNISVPGHLQFVSPNQVNVQVPWELQGQTSAFMKVSIGKFSSLTCDTNGKNCTTYTVPINDYSPSLFEYTEASTGRVLAAALDVNYVLAGTNHPIPRGSFVQLYVNGLGPVNNQPASGEPSPSQPLATTKVTPIVTIGGQTAPVDFSGLIPPYVGLYQVNVKVPTNISAGIQPLVITQNGVISKTSMLPVQ